MKERLLWAADKLELTNEEKAARYKLSYDYDYGTGRLSTYSYIFIIKVFTVQLVMKPVGSAAGLSREEVHETL